MSWYYVKDGQAAGPVPDEALAAQFRGGFIVPTTLIWRSGMKEWQPLSVAAPQLVSTPHLSPSFPAPHSFGSRPVATPPELISGPPPVLPNFFCTLCGQIIPADQLVHISERAVCATCKPAYVQQVSEGVRAPLKQPVLSGAFPGLVIAPQTDLADPAVRLVAHLLDLLFLGLPVVIGYIAFAVIGIGFAGLRMTPTGGGGAGVAEFSAFLIGLACFIGLIFFWMFFYWTWFIGRRGATPGMKIMHVKMVRGNRTPVTYGRALGRAFVFYILNWFTMSLTNLTAFFDAEKRTVVDMICDTRVIKNPN